MGEGLHRVGGQSHWVHKGRTNTKPGDRRCHQGNSKLVTTIWVPTTSYIGLRRGVKKYFQGKIKESQCQTQA